MTRDQRQHRHAQQASAGTVYVIANAGHEHIAGWTSRPSVNGARPPREDRAA